MVRPRSPEEAPSNQVSITPSPNAETEPISVSPAAAGSSGKLRTQRPASHWLSLGLIVVLLAVISCVQLWGPGMGFPADGGRAVGGVIDDAVKWLTRELAWLFDGIRDVITLVLVRLEEGLLWTPWPALIIAVVLLAWGLANWKVALFSALALLAVGFMGLWTSAMETLALVITSVGLSIIIGVPLGVLGARSNLANSAMRPVLDGMQTMPSFVYLVPAILFFSLGNVPAVMATIIYAVPPAIRFTNLGIRQVSPEVLEAARSFGTTPTQLLMKVQIPMALPTIMAGINQTTMMALAMVVVASLVGAGGLGEDVLRALGRQEPGNAVIAGLGIVILAIIIDRITQAVARGRQQALAGDAT